MVNVGVVKSILKKLALTFPVVANLHEERNKYAKEVAHLSNLIDKVKIENLSLKEKIKNVEFVISLSGEDAQRIKVLFVVYFAEIFTGYLDLIKKMLDDTMFDIIVVSTMHSFDGEDFGGEDKIHDMLSRFSIPHLRWNKDTIRVGSVLSKLKMFNPDYMFRQTPWENSVPEDFRLDKFPHCRICYIPYGMYIADTPDALTKLPYIAACWRIFCINISNFNYFKQNSQKTPSNLIVTGHPKLQYLINYQAKSDDWPINMNDGLGRLRVMWAPHHSVTDDWLGFSAFTKTYLHLLEWAKRDIHVEIVIRPHHLTFDSVVKYELLSRHQLNEFLAEVDALSNMSLDPNEDCAPCFKASDILITDGVSFLAEYQILNKPLVFIESDLRRAPFTEFGYDFYEAAYKFQFVEAAIEFMKNYRVSRLDINQSKRIFALNKHLVSGDSATKIIHELKRGVGCC